MISAFILFLGGVVAGAINTLAGNGSVITLSLCTEYIGLNPLIANGTNRLGILTQSISGVYGLHQKNKLNLAGMWRIIAAVIIGSVFGIYTATRISADLFKSFYPWFMVFIFIVLLLRPEKWINAAHSLPRVTSVWEYIIYFIIGFYGGFIQLGVGVFFLASSILISQFPWAIANAAKILVVGSFTFLAVIVFSASGMVHWQTAISLALGQALGAWLAVNYFSSYANAPRISYYLLLSITGLTILRQFLMT